MAGGRRTGTADHKRRSMKLPQLNKTGPAEVPQRVPIELALERQVHAPANQTVSQPLSASSALHSYPEARAAVQRAGEPLGALCVAILVLLAWCVTRRRRVRQLGVAELELAAKYWQVPTEEGAGHDAPARSTSAWVGFGDLCLCRCSRRLRALLERAIVRSPRLAYAVRRWLGAGPKRRDSTFGPSPSYIIEGLSAASLPDVARSTSRASVTSLEGLGRTRQAQPPELCPALSGSTSNPPSVLSRAQLARLAQALPARYAICDWRLVYSTEQHGCSLWTFYSRAVRAAERRARALSTLPNSRLIALCSAACPPVCRPLERRSAAARACWSCWIREGAFSEPISRSRGTGERSPPAKAPSSCARRLRAVPRSRSAARRAVLLPQVRAVLRLRRVLPGKGAPPL